MPRLSSLLYRVCANRCVRSLFIAPEDTHVITDAARNAASEIEINVSTIPSGMISKESDGEVIKQAVSVTVILTKIHVGCGANREVVAVVGVIFNTKSAGSGLSYTTPLAEATTGTSTIDLLQFGLAQFGLTCWTLD